MKRYFIVGSIPQIYRRYPVEGNGRTYYFANTLRYDSYKDLDKRYEKIVN